MQPTFLSAQRIILKDSQIEKRDCLHMLLLRVYSYVHGHVRGKEAPKESSFANNP